MSTRRCVDRLLAQGVDDGIIHGSVGEDERDWQDLIENGFPVVFVNSRPRHLRASYVVS